MAPKTLYHFVDLDRAVRQIETEEGLDAYERAVFDALAHVESLPARQRDAAEPLREAAQMLSGRALMIDFVGDLAKP
jgi:hypothetical protein